MGAREEQEAAAEEKAGVAALTGPHAPAASRPSSPFSSLLFSRLAVGSFRLLVRGEGGRRSRAARGRRRVDEGEDEVGLGWTVLTSSFRSRVDMGL